MHAALRSVRAALAASWRPAAARPRRRRSSSGASAPSLVRPRPARWRSRRARADSVHDHPRPHGRVRCCCSSPARTAPSTCRSSRSRRLRTAIDPGDAARHRHHDSRRQHAVVPRPHGLLLAGRQQEPQSRVSRQGGRHAVRAHRRRDHERIHRARDARRRSALRRRQRVAAAVLVLDHHRRSESRRGRQGHGSRLRPRSHRRGRHHGRPIRRRRSICRTRRSRAASPR